MGQGEKKQVAKLKSVSSAQKSEEKQIYLYNYGHKQMLSCSKLKRTKSVENVKYMIDTIMTTYLTDCSWLMYLYYRFLLYSTFFKNF